MSELIINQILKQKGMTQEDMAKALHVSQSAISQKLRSPSQRSLQDFARVLGVSVSELYAQDTNQPNQANGSRQNQTPTGTTITTVCPCCGHTIQVTLQPSEEQETQPQPTAQPTGQGQE